MVRTLSEGEVPVTSAATPLRDCGATLAAGLVVSMVGVAIAQSVADTDSLVLIASVVLGVLPAALTCAAVLRRQPPSITPADRVTLLRSVFASGCAAVAAMALLGPAPQRSWSFFALVAVTMSLDAVDGWVARHTNTATDAGALLDMQLDAGVLVVLSIAAAPIVGGWVVLIGAMRYLYVAASWAWPLLATPLPRSQFRRGVAAIQGAALAAALAPVVSEPLAAGILAIALALLLVSFGGQILAVRRTVTH